MRRGDQRLLVAVVSIVPHPFVVGPDRRAASGSLPRGFDQHLPHDRRALLGDPAHPVHAARSVLFGHQAEVPPIALLRPNTPASSFHLFDAL